MGAFFTPKGGKVAAMSEEGTAQAGADPQGRAEEFQPILTKEEFVKRTNPFVKDRLERAEKSFTEKNAEVFEKAKRFDEMEEANKSELQKLQERAEAAEEKAKELLQKQELAAWKTEIAKEHEVPVEVLRGSTKEELEEHAKALKEKFASPAAPEVRGDGNHPKANTKKSTRDSFAEAFGKITNR